MLILQGSRSILSLSPWHEKSKTIPFTILFLEDIHYLAVLVAYLIIGFVVGKFLGRDCFMGWRGSVRIPGIDPCPIRDGKHRSSVSNHTDANTCYRGR